MPNTARFFRISFFVACLFVLSATATLAQTPPTEGAQPITDGAQPVSLAEPEQPTDDGKGAAGAHHKFPWGWCTQYAADTYRARNGRNVTWRGNARDWGVNASRAGFRISTDANSITRNSILVFGPTKTNSYGHVAIADEVVKGSYVVVSEQNWKGFGIVSRRKINWGDLRSRYQFTSVILP
jgi:surface antigen